MQSHACCTWNTIIASASIRPEPSPPINHNNGHYSNHVLSAEYEVVSRSISVRSSTTLHRSHWHSHNQCRSAHRKRFSLVSRSPTKTLLNILFQLVRTATVYSRHLFLHNAQLLSGMATLYNCKDLTVLSEANIAVYSPSTRTEVTPRNNSSLL
jgi:hypothetical protein